MNFHKLLLLLSRFSQPARDGWVKTYWIPCSARAAHRVLNVHNEPHQGAGKGRFLNVIFYHIKLRKFDSIRRFRNEASMPGVLYLYAKGVSPRDVVNTSVAYLLYNTRLAWAG